MNIAFIQEWTEFAETAGVNLYEVIDAIRLRPTHKNIMIYGLVLEVIVDKGSFIRQAGRA